MKTQKIENTNYKNEFEKFNLGLRDSDYHTDMFTFLILDCFVFTFFILEFALSNAENEVSSARWVGAIIR